MAKINLTAKKVEQLRKVPGRHRDAEVKGLLLVVTSPTSASWQLRYEIAGVEKWMGLGGLRDVPLAAARERARAMRLQLVSGVDPLAAKCAGKAARRAADLRSMTFRQAAESYLAAHSSKWTNAKHAAQWPTSLAQYAYPIIGDLPVAEVDTALILKVLEQPVAADRQYLGGSLWISRHETASRLRGRIEAVLAWAQVRGYRSGPNPAQWQRHLSEVLPNGQEKEHHKAMAFRDLPAFVAALRQQGGVATKALEFLILTAARTAKCLARGGVRSTLTSACG